MHPASPPRLVSKSVRADTLMTSGYAAGTKLPALTAELPAPATMMIPAAWAEQTAVCSGSVWQSPHARCSPKLMFMTSMSFELSPSAFRAITWSKPHRTSDSLELPESSKTLTATRSASGATPTTPTLFTGAATVPATCVPCP